VKTTDFFLRKRGNFCHNCAELHLTTFCYRCQFDYLSVLLVDVLQVVQYIAAQGSVETLFIGETGNIYIILWQIIQDN